MNLRNDSENIKKLFNVSRLNEASNLDYKHCSHFNNLRFLTSLIKITKAASQNEKKSIEQLENMKMIERGFLPTKVREVK